MIRRNFFMVFGLLMSALKFGAHAGVKQQHEVEERKRDSLFKTPPYLQNATATGMTIMWSTNRPCYSWVEFGKTAELGEKANTVIDGQISANNRLNKIRLSGLKEGAKCFYKVCSRRIVKFGAYKVEWGKTECSDIFSFETIDPAAEKVTCVFFNDLHDNHALYNALGRQIEGLEYDFSVFNGDIYNDPSSENGVIESLNVFNKGVGASEKNVIYLRGNHEIRGAYSRCWSQHFDTPESRQYYAVTRGPIRFIFMDVGEDKPDSHPAYSGLNDFSSFRTEQAEWLKHEIKSEAFKKAAFRVLIHHIPLFGYPKSGWIKLCREWLPIINKSGIDISIHGHTHKHKIHLPNADKGHDFPVIVGGGKKMKDGTVIILKATTKELKLKMIDSKGLQCGEYTLNA